MSDKRLTTDELEAILHKVEVWAHWSDAEALRKHIASIEGERDQLRAALEEIARNAPDADPSPQPKEWLQNAWAMWIAGKIAKQALARLAGESEKR